MGYDAQALSALAKLYGAGKATDPAQQALGAAQGVSSGASAVGGLTGNSSLANLGGYSGALSSLLGGAGLGFGLYNTITDPNLSSGQKAGTSALQTGEGAVALSPALAGATAGTALGPIFAALAPAAPYLAAVLAAQAIGGQLEKSGSPQVRGAGKAIEAPILPVMGLESVITGKQSPRAAFNSMIQSTQQLPVIGGAMKSFENFFGLGTTPTTGTMFRSQMGNLARQFPELKGFNPNLAPKGGKSYAQYMSPEQIATYSPEAISAADAIAAKMAPLSPYAKKGKAATDYAEQLSQALLGNYGNDITGMAPGILARFQPQQAAVASGGMSLAQRIKAEMNRSR